MPPQTGSNRPPLWQLLLSIAGMAVLYVGMLALKQKTVDRNPVMDPVREVTSLPRVLLLGDSISIGYTVLVRARLQSVANVQRAPVNCQSTKFGLENIETWLKGQRWDCVFFNFGMHDLKYVDSKGENASPTEGQHLVSPADYEANLRALVARMKKTNATLLFGTTTPVPKNAEWREPEDVVQYNDIAKRVMESEGVEVVDLYAKIEPRFKEFHEPKKFQLNAAGSTFLASTVSQAIIDALEQRKSAKRLELEQDLE